ncbi:MAG TPA: MFS transporter [Pyrinomonadaceae bacterium]|nr:MFS transporter [Pyrinomonadaceae bacterium]
MGGSLTYTQLLRRNRPFRWLWSGQVISELGNWFNFIASLGLVRAVSNAAPEVTTIILIARLIPFTLFAPLAGAFVDRWSRRAVMIASDFARVLAALGFLLVRRPEDLWIAYVCTIFLSLFGTFFEAAKNASVPNITGERDLLAGNALMFSSRYLWMALGSALGGWTAAYVGYQAAFIINALSFFVSAYSVWLVPEEKTRKEEPAEEPEKGFFSSLWSDVKEGWHYIGSNSLVTTIIVVTMLCAIGVGAMNLIADRLGALVFARQSGISQDSAVAAIYFAVGLGLFFGMLIARLVGSYLESRKRTIIFVGCSLVIQGIFFGLAGVMPTLLLACVMVVVSRVFLGAELAVQETLLMRLVPDDLRGRVSMIHHAGEILTWGLATALAGWSLGWLTPRSLTLISGLVSGTAGLAWLALFITRSVRLPQRLKGGMADQPAAAGD